MSWGLNTGGGGLSVSALWWLRCLAVVVGQNGVRRFGLGDGRVVSGSGQGRFPVLGHSAGQREGMELFPYAEC